MNKRTSRAPFVQLVAVGNDFATWFDPARRLLHPQARGPPFVISRLALPVSYNGLSKKLAKYTPKQWRAVCDDNCFFGPHPDRLDSHVIRSATFLDEVNAFTLGTFSRSYRSNQRVDAVVQFYTLPPSDLAYAQRIEAPQGYFSGFV